MKDPKKNCFLAYQLLYVAFIVLPLIAGVDKYFNGLCDWSQYLSPWIKDTFDTHSVMKIIGTIEILAGLLVVFNPGFGGWVVAVWLWCIILNLLSFQGYFDVALRDFCLSLAALALANLSDIYFVSSLRQDKKRKAVGGESAGDEVKVN